MGNNDQGKSSFIQSTVAAAKAALEKARLQKRHGHDNSNHNSHNENKSVTNVLNLKVDHLGRPIDDDGNVIELKPKIQCTLKINQNLNNELKNDEIIIKKQLEKKPERVQGWHDPTIIRTNKNRKMAFCFVEKDKYVKLERQMQREIEDKTLNSNAKTLVHQKKKYLEIQERRLKEVFESNKEMDIDTCNDKVKSWEDEPEVEWWDMALLKKYELNDRRDSSYQPFLPLLSDYYINEITHYISHPSPLKADEFKSHNIPNIYLTVKERKRLRRRNRQEKEKAKQDKIRIGLLPPPPPKIKLSNLMRVLSSSLVSDPSKVEYEVRAQMEQRLKGHNMRNQSRKLNAEDRSRKHANKWKLTIGDVVYIAFFSISSLENPKLLFKIDVNAQQFHLTGVCIICPQSPAMIVVEGGAIAVKRYRKLLLDRISWDGESCKLLWQGQATHRNFGNWKVSILRNENEVRDVLGECSYYFDMLKDDYQSGSCSHPSGIESIPLED